MSNSITLGVYFVNKLCRNLKQNMWLLLRLRAGAAVAKLGKTLPRYVL